MFVYPAIDVRGGQAVRLRQGDYAQETVFDADPVAVARRWVKLGADRIHVVDLDGAKAGKPVNADLIRRLCDSVPVPVQLGGGIRSDDDLTAVFGWGVKWAVLGTKAVQNPEWVKRVAAQFPQRIVLGVDARDGFVATDGWTNTSKTLATDLIAAVEQSPLAAVVYTDIATDGMMAGPNYAALDHVRNSTRLPVIASGGVSDLNHVRRLVVGGVYGCIVGRALYEGTLQLNDVLDLARATPGTPGGDSH